MLQHDIILTTEGYTYNLWATKKILRANVRCGSTFVFSLILNQIETKLQIKKIVYRSLSQQLFKAHFQKTSGFWMLFGELTSSDMTFVIADYVSQAIAYTAK